MQNAYINITPPLEAIQEFKVQTNNPTAEFGVFGGGAVNLTLRSGTNEFHGSVFDYIRDDSINSKSYFAQTKAPYNSHQFGATLGGPILKNKAFFFGDYQGLRLDQGRKALLTVPTALMRQGVFTEIKDVIYDPVTGQPFAGNVVPAARINPITAKVLRDIYPLPNLPHLPQLQRERACAGPGPDPAAAAVLRRGADNHHDQPARRRWIDLVRRAPGQARQALRARPPGARGLHVLPLRVPNARAEEGKALRCARRTLSPEEIFGSRCP